MISGRLSFADKFFLCVVACCVFSPSSHKNLGEVLWCLTLFSLEINLDFSGPWLFFTSVKIVLSGSFHSYLQAV